MIDRRSIHRLVPVTLALAAIAGAAAAAAAEPRVALIATGGTIANHSRGRLSGARLVESTPGLDDIARVEPETFSTRASLALSLGDWLRLSRRVQALAADAGLAGVVITTGTDTLEELAWFLQLTVRADRPIVLTGAMRRPEAADADGPENLRQAVRVAIAEEARGLGVLVCVGGRIHAARYATKASTHSLDAFFSAGAGPVGHVSGSRVRLSPDATTLHPARVFDVSRVRRLPRVDILLTYQQAPGDLVDAAVEGGARGIVMAAVGAGSITRAQSTAARQALHRGLVVVVASRVPDGQVSAEELPAKSGLIAAGTLTPVKARILLMVALATGTPRDEIRAIFAEL